MFWDKCRYLHAVVIILVLFGAFGYIQTSISNVFSNVLVSLDFSFLSRVAVTTNGFTFRIQRMFGL